MIETPVHIDLNEIEVSKDFSGHPLKFTKVTFTNIGHIPVFIGKIPLIPGASYQINYEHPHVITKTFAIRFDTTATPVDAAYRAHYALVNAPKLVIQTMTFKQ